MEEVIKQDFVEEEVKKQVEEVPELSPEEYAEMEKEHSRVFKVSPILNKFIDKIVERSLSDHDTVIAVNGNQGLGKSDFAVWLGREVTARLGQREFNLYNDVVWKGEKKEIYNKMYGEENKRVALVFDEFQTYASKHKWFTKEARYLEDVFLVSRTQQKPCILVGPRVNDFSEIFRNQRIVMSCEKLARNYVAVFIRHPSPNVKDPWYTSELEKLISARGQHFIQTSPIQKAAIYRANLPNFLTAFFCPRLDRRTRQQYELISNRVKLESLSLQKDDEKKIFDKNRDEWFARSIKLMRDSGKTQKEIAAELGCSTQVVGKMLIDLGKYELKKLAS